jgi:hypothetical protein
MTYILRIKLGSLAEYRITLDRNSKSGVAEFIIRGEIVAFCNYLNNLDDSSLQDPSLTRFSNDYGLPIERVNLWMSLIKDEKVSSVTSWTY